jgi:hypothetical protein
MKEKNHKTRILYPEKLSFIIGGEIKTFHDKQNLKQLVITKLAIQ